MREITSAAELTDRLKELRMQKGLSQAALAKAVGVSRPMISYFERKTTFINFNDLLALMHALSVKLYINK